VTSDEGRFERIRFFDGINPYHDAVAQHDESGTSSDAGRGSFHRVIVTTPQREGDNHAAEGYQ
jgi:hypothetical protein